MSLETLLEAAEYLERNNFFKNLDDPTSTSLRTRSESCELSGDCNGSNSAGGHLRLDPNLPISFQFHTYSNLSSTQQQLNSSLVNGNRSSDPSGKRLSNGQRQNHNSAGRAKSASFTVGHRNAYQQQQSPGGASLGHRRGGRNASMSEGGCSSPSFTSSRHRELHKTLEKNRRAHLRSCFEQLKQELPKSDGSERKYSHINIIHYAIRYIQQLKQMENDQEGELRRLSMQNRRYLDTMEQLSEQVLCRLDDLSQESSDTLAKKELVEEQVLEHDDRKSDLIIGHMDDQIAHIVSVDSQGGECNSTSDHSLYASMDMMESDSFAASAKSAQHHKEMDQLLLQVERTLLCGSLEKEKSVPLSASSSSGCSTSMAGSADSAATYSGGRSFTGCDSDEPGALRIDTEIDNEMEEEDDEHRLDIDLGDEFEIEEEELEEMEENHSAISTTGNTHRNLNGSRLSQMKTANPSPNSSQQLVVCHQYTDEGTATGELRIVC